MIHVCIFAIYKHYIFIISGLPIGEREHIKSANKEKQKYRKELQDQIAKNLIKKQRLKFFNLF